MTLQASNSPGGWYPLSRPGASESWVDQKIVSNEFPFAVRALFNAFNAGFTAGTTPAFSPDALSGEITADVRLGLDIAVLPFPVLNLLGLLKEWDNACGRHGEIEANLGLMASLERDCLELEAQLTSWPENDPGRAARQKEIDGKKAVCQKLVARNNALRALAPPVEGRAATVGSGFIPVPVALSNGVTSVLKVHANAAVDATKAVDATAVHGLSDVAASTVGGLAIGLINSACHLIRAFPEVDRAMAQLDGLKAAEHRLAEAVEACLPRLGDRAALKEVLDNLVASLVPLIGNTRSQARIVAVDGFFRTVQGASGLALKSAGIAAAVLGPAAPFAAGVAIAGMAMGAGWLGWQAARLWWAQTLRVDAAKIENQLRNDVAIARKSLEAGAATPHVSAAMAPWLKLIEACREDGAQGPLAGFLRQAGISESVIGACRAREKAAIDQVAPLFAAFKESLLTAVPAVTQARIDALKKRKDPRDALNGFILDVENPDRPAQAQGNKALPPTALKNQGNTLTLAEVQHHLAAFKAGTVCDLSAHQGQAAKWLAQFFEEAKARPQAMQALEKDLLARVKLFIDLSRNSDERAIACLSGRYPGLRGKAKFGDRVVQETAEAYLRSKYAGPAFEEKLALLQHLAQKGALVRRSTFMEWAKTYKTWQPTGAALEMAKWLSQPRPSPGAGLVAQVLEKQPGASAREHEKAVALLQPHFPQVDWSPHHLGTALKALDACDAKALLNSAPQRPQVETRTLAMGQAPARARADELNLRAVRNALLLRRGLARSAASREEPVQALKALHARHPRVAQAVLEALMGKRFEVPDLPDDVAGQVKAIRNAYGDHFFEDETKGRSVFFIPRKPGPGEDQALARLAKTLCRQDAPMRGQGRKHWPSSLVTASTQALLNQRTGPRFPAPLKRRAMADQLQRNLDSLREGTPALFSPLWTPASYGDTAVAHAVRSQHLQALFPTERYDQADEAKCQDIDDTVTLLDAWIRKTPRGRTVLRAMALGGPIQSRAAMRWLLDRPTEMSDARQNEIRQIAQSMPDKGGSSKPVLKALAERLAAWRQQPAPGRPETPVQRYESLGDFMAQVEPGSDQEKREALLRQVKHRRRFSGTSGSTNAATPPGERNELPSASLFSRQYQPLNAPRGDLPIPREGVERVSAAS